METQTSVLMGRVVPAIGGGLFTNPPQPTNIEIQRLENIIRGQEEQIKLRDRVITGVKKVVAHKNEIIGKLYKELADRDAILDQLEVQVMGLVGKGE